MERYTELNSSIFNIRENPCGHLCEPFNNKYCLLHETSEPLIEEMSVTIREVADPFKACRMAQGLCRILVQTRNFKFDNIELEENVSLLSKEKDELHKDSLTGVYSGKGLESILGQMYEQSNLFKLLNRGYYVRIICADVNDLKLHNAGPGGHEQGDLAIKTVGSALTRFIEAGRRANQVINKENNYHVDNRRKEESLIPTRFVARSNDRGDEFLAISLISKNGARRNKETQDTLDQILSNLHYEYNDELYKVSATYGLITLKMPTTLPSFHHVIKQIDSAMMKHKYKVKAMQKADPSGIHEKPSMGIMLKSVDNIDID